MTARYVKTVHHLKTVQPYFGEVWKGLKHFDVRLNDRDFKVGDECFLKEYDPDTKEFSGVWIRVKIIYILKNYHAIAPDHVVFGFHRIEKFLP